MKEIGEALKKAREAKGMTLEDIHDATKIRIHYLMAIENGEFDEIPGEVYLKGFLRNYAEIVGLDGQGIIEEYKTWRSRLKAESRAETGIEGGSYGAEAPPALQAIGRVRRHRTRPRRARALVVLTLLILAGLIIASIVYYVYRQERRPEAIPVAPAAPAVPSGPLPKTKVPKAPKSEVRSPMPPTPKPPPETQSGSPIPQGIASEVPSSRVQDTHELRAIVSERCWVKVIADGKVVFERTMLSGEVVSWRARKQIRIKVGNAGGIEISFDGSRPEVMGKSGEVVEKAFPEGDLGPT